MAEREDLPKNPALDEMRKVYREALFEYLRDHTGREERKTLIKEAIKEMWREALQHFGWWSFRTVALGAFLLGLVIWLEHNGWTRITK